MKTIHLIVPENPVPSQLIKALVDYEDSRRDFRAIQIPKMKQPVTKVWRPVGIFNKITKYLP